MISVCVIAKNEEAVIARCIDSVKDLAGEIVILDTGSTDRTMEIAREMGARVFEQPWEDNFAKAKNACMSHATGDYIFFLDADETFVGDAEMLKAEIAAFPDSDLYHGKMTYPNHAYEFVTTKISPRGRGIWIGKCHEYLNPINKIWVNTHLPNLIILHQPTEGKENATKRNLRIINRALKDAPRDEPNLVPRYNYYYARELRDNGEYEEAIKYYRTYLDFGYTWNAERHSAACDMANCHMFLGRTKEARQACFEAIEIDSTLITPYIILGFMAHASKNWRELAGWCRMALTMKDRPHPLFDNITYRKDTAHRNLGVALWYLGEFEKGRQHLLEALKYSPDDPQILENLKFFKVGP